MAIEILGRVGRKVGVMDEPASGLFYLQDAKLAFYKNTFPPHYGKKGHCRAGFLSRVLPHGKEIFAMQNPKNARQRNDARQRLD
jgi:hypothetical protein